MIAALFVAVWTFIALQFRKSKKPRKMATWLSGKKVSHDPVGTSTTGPVDIT